MAAPERPQLRRLTLRRIENHEPPMMVLDDPLRFCPTPIMLPLELLPIVKCFNGHNSAEDIQRQIRETIQKRVELDFLRRLIEEMDRALAFEGPSYEAAVRAYLDAETRAPDLAGRAYEADPRRLTAQLDGYFRSRGGAGKLSVAPSKNGSANHPRLRAVISPHIDYTRGGTAYTWAYKRLVEECDAEVFVILGVAHQYCRSRFILTRKDFATPLGLAKTDRAFVDRLAAAVGGDPFADELTHRSEHSVEFQAVFLKHVLGDRPFTIVPILVGSFHDFVERQADPIADEEIARFIESIWEVERADGRKVAYIGGVDLCHVGPEFGDVGSVDAGVRDQIRRFDEDLLGRAQASDPAGWFRTAADVGDRWRVCGLAATYTMLHAIGPTKGEVLRYDQAVDERGRCCVSFASMVFHEAHPVDG